MDDATIDYRLKQIEDSVKEVRDLIVETKLQRKDIDDIKDAVKKNTDDIMTLKLSPAKKWNSVVELVLKLVLTAAIGVVLVKIGLGG